MPGQAVFSEQAEQFAAVVNALLQSEETRAAFTKEPIATLEKYGIAFKDRTVAKKVEAELRQYAGEVSEVDICPPYFFARVSAFNVPRTYVRTHSIVRATNITWVARGDLEDVMKIDQPRVNAFVTQVGMEARIGALEARIAELEKLR